MVNMAQFKERKYAVVELTRDSKKPRKKATVEVIRLASSIKDARSKRKSYLEKHPRADKKNVRVTRLPLLSQV